MANILHVVNGDAAALLLEKSGIGGEIVVWREMLCEGPLAIEVASDEFWANRYAYFENELGINKLEYFDKTIKEIVKLENLSGYTEVVLWFEYDLFCQVNLLALCTYLLDNYVKKANYYLICTGIEKGEKILQSLSDFPPSEFKILYNNKLVLSKINLLFAKECWNVYFENNIKKLKEFDFNQNSKFQYLQLAINQHLERFPGDNGLNQIENKILEIINFNSFTEKEIVENLLIWQQNETIYGFGDVQYFQYLNKLEIYYTIKECNYYLNENGYSKINL